MSDSTHATMDENWMRCAIGEAEWAADEGEVPIGAVVVRDERIIGRGHNQRERLRDPTAHAEMLAITAAAEAVGDWRLERCTLFVTLEPCAMCAGAMIWARIRRVAYGCRDGKAGACGTVIDLSKVKGFNHHFDVTGGVLEGECRSLIRSFFRKKRR